MAKELPPRAKELIKSLVDQYTEEDQSARNILLLKAKRLKLFWDGVSSVWYDSVAHDWRVWDQYIQAQSTTDQAYYDKPANIFRAYLESIIAALSITVPPVKCFPDDADDPLDLDTANAGDKIYGIIFKHIDGNLKWLNALFKYMTEGMVGCYSYPKKDKSYGEYEEEEYEDVDEVHDYKMCPNCGHTMDDQLIAGDNPEDEFMPSYDEGEDLCESCQQMVMPDKIQSTLTIPRLVGITKNPKSRQCVEMYGVLNVKTPLYARTQEEMPYWSYSYEAAPSIAMELYPEYKKCFDEGDSLSNNGAWDQYEMWARLSSQYRGQFPDNVVTIRHFWLRPAAFNECADADTKYLKKKFPNGCHAVLINDHLISMVDEAPDDCWTFTINPLTDYAQHDPIAMLLTSMQEITNELISLTLQTIEHGVPQTFADPTVVDFVGYQQLEVLPGTIIPTKTISGNKSVQQAFHEVKTATLSGEVLPFFQQIQSLAQLVSGALPSLFGGQLEGSETASEYSMSKAQALQRQQNTYKIFTTFWKTIWGKVIPSYIKEVKEDERHVSRTDDGNFVNSFIRMAELEGKIGSVELDASDNLPLTWDQKRNAIMQLLQAANPVILEALGSPENLPLIREAIGLPDFYIPGEDEVEAEYRMIKLLLNSEPIPQGVGPTGEMIEGPSIPAEPIIENPAIRFTIDKKWLLSDAGQVARVDNEMGYKNVLLRAQQFFQILQSAPPPTDEKGAAPGKKANPKDKPAPIQGEEDVATVS